MKKPELEDFNLTENSETLYLAQLDKYKKACENVDEKINNAKKSRNKIVGWFCFISTVVIFIILCIISNSLNNGDTNGDTQAALGLFLIFFPFIYPFAIIKLFWISDDYFASKFEKAKTQRFIDSLSIVAVEKYKYVNKQLEENFDKYQSALSDFNAHIRNLEEQKKAYIRNLEEQKKRILLKFWNDLSGFEFEKEVAKIYAYLGYHASVTKAVGDGGVDIVLTKNNERIAVQCKHHKGKVGPHDVRALCGVVANEYYSYGIFVSLNGFTQTVEDEVRRGKIKIELVTIEDLIAIQKKILEQFEKENNGKNLNSDNVANTNLETRQELVIQDGQLLEVKKTNENGHVEIPDGVTSIDSAAFSNCNNLITITIPDSVTSIGDEAFSGCDNLKYNEYDNAYYLGNNDNPYLVLIKIQDTSVATLTINDKTKLIYDNAFSGCTNLTRVTIPNSVTSIGDDVFSGCKNLTSVTIPESVTSLGGESGYMIGGSNNIESVYITDISAWCNIKFTLSTTYFSSPTLHVHDLYLNNKLVTDLIIPDTVTSIKDY